MKFTLSWLKDHLDTDEPLEKLSQKLTMIGLEVEHIDDKAKALSAFTIARVISAEQHPNADRLRVCMVDTGNGAPVQVVCGAPNARTGMKSVFSPPGTFIPGKNITLGVGTIRGVESRGMLCSAAELELSNDHDGIIELPEDAPVGVQYTEWAKLGDPMIEINLTPNRADCTSMHGIARDLSAADMGTLKDPAIKPVKGAFPSPVKVTVEDPTLCPGFALRLVRGVKNGPSPEWLQKRLAAIGLRPINALVDITNYMTYDRGRPLHVFDAAKVKGDLVVRRAKAGETLLALDGKIYTLDETICVIADANGVESLAGIMGGEASGCSETTTDVLIESALWNEIQHRPHRPQARHQFGRALPLRARCRSGVHGAGSRACNAAGDGPVRRHAVRSRRRRQVAWRRPHHRLSAQRGEAAGRHRGAAGRDPPDPRPSRLHHRRQWRGHQGRHSVLARRCGGQGRHRRRDRADRRRRSRAACAVRSGRCTAQAHPHPDPVAHPPRQARAGRTRHGRGGHLVVRCKSRRPSCSAAARPSSRLPTRSHRICRTCARA